MEREAQGRGHFAERVASEIISLPMFPQLSAEQQLLVMAAVLPPVAATGMAYVRALASY